MKYALLIARQRSGTGALGSVLDKHPKFKYLEEIFHPSNIGQKLNFFTYLRDRVPTHPDDALPDARYSVFERYLQDLHEEFNGRTLIVDVKYRSLHHLDAGWRGLVERPTLLREATKKEVPILHLTRRNVLRGFVSGRLAEANNVWHTDRDDALQFRSIEINVRKLLNHLNNIEREIALVDEWLKSAPNVVQFDYRDLFDEGGLIAESVADAIAATLCTEPFADRKPRYVKQAPTDLREAIENFASVERALAGTPHQWMLDSC